MPRFLEVTINDASKTRVLINLDKIVSVAPDAFSGTSKVMISGYIFECTEKYEDIAQMIKPN